jgi:glyoxylase-like metal-dependent hydrolase (beta-lactamase superfamily II)
VCEGLTDKPISVINTHGHFDHAGGNFAFSEIWIHPMDLPLMYTQCTVSQREKFAMGFCTTAFWNKEDVEQIKPLICNDAREGMKFELGGRMLEVLETPGHTRGSICLLDKKNRLLFAGDTCNTNTLLYLDGSSTVEKYLSSLKKLKQQQNLFDTYLICHEDTPLDKSCIDDAICCCEEILAGTDDAEPGENLGLSCLYAKKRDTRNRRLDGRLGNVAYMRNNIR